MIIIRRAKEEDCPFIARVHTSAVRAIPIGYYAPEEIEAWAIPHKLESYQQFVHHKEFYVATEGEIIVGFGVLNRETRQIEAVYASPETKGQGVGLKLLQKLEEQGRDLGFEALHLNASLNATGFYQRAGYVALEESKYRLASGVEIRCVPMIKALVPEADTI
jgi:N-acetylglutamate synthase-like GNAT family acetyltransferase